MLKVNADVKTVGKGKKKVQKAAVGEAGVVVVPMKVLEVIFGQATNCQLHVLRKLVSGGIGEKDVKGVVDDWKVRARVITIFLEATSWDRAWGKKVEANMTWEKAKEQFGETLLGMCTTLFL